MAAFARGRSQTLAPDTWSHRSRPGCRQDQTPVWLSDRLSPANCAYDLRSGIFSELWFPLEIEPQEPDFLIEETPNRIFLGADFEVLEIPGHCPGSLCFFSPKDKLFIGGDVLFAGSIGRGDLPGGDIDLLITGIRKKLFPLGDDVTILPGHGPPTKIGIERKTNPFVGKQ